MAIPLSYNLRNLAVRKTTTIMTALGIGLTVAVLVSVLSLLEGLNTAFQSSGHPRHVLVLRKGGGSELSSIIQRSQFLEAIKFRPMVERDAQGEPMASPELVQTVNLPSKEAPDGMNLTVRGVMAVGRAMREETRLAEGRWYAEGRREAVVGSSVANRYPGAQIGQRIRFGRGDWEVVGVFHSDYPARNSEIWLDANQMAADFGRMEAFSSVLVRTQDELATQALINELESDQRLQIEALTEREYFKKQTSSGDVIKYLGTFVAIIMAIGSCFAAMNTMYAAVARRSQEIGTLRVLGFSRRSILLSFFLESLFLSLLGGVVGVLLVLPLNGFSTGVGSFVTFTEIAFQLRMSPGVIGAGLAFALVIGAFGGLFPASNAARKQILTALRQI
ncbi:MAG: ABC transporter permease [Bryobacteraceae bacterium]|nr:ABC transporter permease [Bryobacteraceae bacterium]